MSDFLNGKLDNVTIRKTLSEYKYSDGFRASKKLIDDIIEKFWFHDFYNSFISDPVFLKYLIKYLDNVKPKKFGRFDFYQFLFNQIVKPKNKRSTLQLIALKFEQLQTDTIRPPDYKKLLKSLKVARGMFNISWMQKHHLAKVEKKDNKEYFIWEHHTVSEFLTAEYILQSENPIEEFQNLAVLDQEGVVAIKPSWNGVLRFLLESPRGTEVLHWLITFLEEHKDSIDDSLSELLTFVGTEIPAQMKRRIFDLIYNLYFDRIAWLPVWTRSRISKFVDEESYTRLKADIKKWPNITETFVRRGNVVSVIEGLLENNNKLLNLEEGEFWKKKLIDFANNPEDDGNGVLQRHSLAALAHFKNEEVIPLVAKKCFEETQDSLVRDEFIQFCVKSAPNSRHTIDYLIEGIKKGSTIYARRGLYEVNAKTGIGYLLSNISEDEEFLKTFLKHESIFDKEGADKELVTNIQNKLSPKIIKELKRLIFTVLRIDDYYGEDKSSFLREVIRLIESHSRGYLFEFLDDINREKDEQKIDRLFYDSKEFLALLLTKESIKQYFEVLEKFPERTRRDAQYPVYVAKRVNGLTGEQAYKEAVKLKLVQPVDDRQYQEDFEEQQKKRSQEIYESFLQQLEPEAGKYMTGVFKYFLQHRKEIEEHWQKKDKERLFKLAVDEGIRKIDPRQFKVKIESRHEGNSRFTWSAPASYFGDVLKVVKEFAPEEIKKQRKRTIDFIPYEFDTGSLLDFVEKIKDGELEWVNKVMNDKKDDRRYLIPQTYIYLVGEYAKRGCKLPSVKPVLKSFIGDSLIQEHNQRAALENLVHFTDKSDTSTKKFLKRIVEKSKSHELTKAANGLLISIYKDEKAIDWRFNQLKKPLTTERKLDGEAYWVGPIENELDTMAFAKPLIDLRNEKYLQKFFDLLRYSFKVLQENQDKKYWDYVNYLWQIVIAFVDNLKERGSFRPLLALEDWAAKNATVQDSNWLAARIRELRKIYINEIGRAKL